MCDLIENSEFGDWLMGEISQTLKQLKSTKPDRARADQLRLETLKIAKDTLLEYLTTQQKMMEAASAVRDEQRGAACQSRW
jgi:LPS sulfotransferase NodH